jgi:hypothetical protein
MPTEVEGLLRELAPQVLGTLVRRYGDLDTCAVAGRSCDQAHPRTRGQPARF